MARIFTTGSSDGLGLAAAQLLLEKGHSVDWRAVNPLVGAAVDGQALRQILDLRPNLLLLGICAIDADEGLAAFHNEDAQMKRALVQRSGSVAIAVLNEKLSASAPFQVAAVDVVGDLVVEEDAPKKVVLGFESRGIRIHWAKSSNC